MRFDHRHVLACVAVGIGVIAGCRGGGRSGSSDTPNAPARADSSQSAAPSTATRSDSVILRTDKTRYRAGEKMTLTLENRSGASYTFNPCTRSIERESGGAWSKVAEEGRMCTMEAWILDPRGTRSGPTELPSSLAPGRFRVVVLLTREQPGGSGSSVSAVSDSFTVE
jgi:hypothetical protein